ncbi:MAG: hypothetical protein AAFY98_10800 [Verrucomicrobiota bacterium]
MKERIFLIACGAGVAYGAHVLFGMTEWVLQGGVPGYGMIGFIEFPLLIGAFLIPAIVALRNRFSIHPALLALTLVCIIYQAFLALNYFAVSADSISDYCFSVGRMILWITIGGLLIYLRKVNTPNSSVASTP